MKKLATTGIWFLLIIVLLGTGVKLGHAENFFKKLSEDVDAINKLGSQTVLNETVNLRAHQARAWSLNLPQKRTLKLNVDVVRGNPIGVIVMLDNEWQYCQKNVKQCKGYPVFRDYSITKYEKSINVDAGNYIMAIYDKTLGILSQSNSDVKILAVVSQN